MNKSLSEFITEQENGYTTSTSDSVEKSYCECAAALSLAQCYAEQAVLMEYAENCGYDSLNIFTEAEEEKKESIFARAKAGLKNGWDKIVQFFKAIYRKIAGYITDKRMDDLKEAIGNLGPDDKINGVAHSVTVFPEFIEVFAETTEKMKQMYADGAIGSALTHQVDAACNRLDSFIKDAESTLEKKATSSTTGAELKAKFSAKFEKGHIQEVLKNIDKSIDELEKNVKKVDKNKDASAEDKTKATADKSVAEALQKLINASTKAYDIALKAFHDGYSSLKGGITKAEKDKDKVKAESAFYFV